GGCLQDDTKVKVEKDGSGTLSLTRRVDLERLKDLTDMAMQFNGGAPAGQEAKEKPQPLFTLADMKAAIAAVDGIKITKSDEKIDEGKTQTITLDVAFAKLSSLPKAELFPSTTLSKNEDGSYTLTIDATGSVNDAGEKAGASGAL